MGVVMGALTPSGVPAWAASVAIFGEGMPAVYHKRKRPLGTMPRGRKSEAGRTPGRIGGGPRTRTRERLRPPRGSEPVPPFVPDFQDVNTHAHRPAIFS